MAHRLPPAGIKNVKTEAFQLYQVRQVFVELQPAPKSTYGRVHGPPTCPILLSCCLEQRPKTPPLSCLEQRSFQCPTFQPCGRGNYINPLRCDKGYPTQACAHLLPPAGHPTPPSDSFMFHLVRPAQVSTKDELPDETDAITDHCCSQCSTCPCCSRPPAHNCCKCQKAVSCCKCQKVVSCCKCQKAVNCQAARRRRKSAAPKEGVCCCQVACSCRCPQRRRNLSVCKKKANDCNPISFIDENEPLCSQQPTFSLEQADQTCSNNQKSSFHQTEQPSSNSHISSFHTTEQPSSTNQLKFPSTTKAEVIQRPGTNKRTRPEGHAARAAKQEGLVSRFRRQP